MLGHFAIARFFPNVVVTCLGFTLTACAGHGDDVSSESGSSASTEATTDEPPLTDDEAHQLLLDSQCFTCHAVDRKLVGPAFRDVAKLYQRQASVGPDGERTVSDSTVNAIATRVVMGSVDRWGSVPMPDNEGLITRQDAIRLTRWIVQLPPQ
jgi:cytochrome c